MQYLHGVADLRTAVTCITHSVSVPICLHWVRHFGTVIQHILDSCKTSTHITSHRMMLLRHKVEQFIKLNSLYHLHRCLHRKSLPLRYCQYLSGRCWERWDSYHTRHRMNRCQSSADLYWTPTDSYPETYTFIHRET